MIKLTYKHISDMNFARGIGKIAQHPFENQLVAYNIAKIVRRFDAFVKDVQKEFIELLKKFAELDEKGEFVQDNDVPGTYKIAEDKKEAFAEAKKAFEATEFTLDCHKVRLDDLKGVNLSAIDFITLEDVISEVTHLEEPTNEDKVPTAATAVS